MKKNHLILAPCLFALAACGTTKEDRAITGGLIGAGAGAVVGSAVGATGQGALIGAGVGAATGALTDPENIDIGKPLWKR